jgi:hypothetical protein
MYHTYVMSIVCRLYALTGDLIECVVSPHVMRCFAWRYRYQDCLLRKIIAERLT